MRFLPWIGHAIGVIATSLAAGAIYFFAGLSWAMHSSARDSIMKWTGASVVVLMVALVAVGIWQRIAWRWLLRMFAASGGFLVFLAWDGARPAPPPLGPVIPANSPSYEAFRWISKNDAHSRVAQQSESLAKIEPFPLERRDWPAYFAARREFFIHAWNDDSFGRGWVDTMAKNVPEGIYPRSDDLQKHIDGIAYLRLSRVQLGYASVLLLDHREEEAARLLVPYLRANYHLERAGELMLTEMCAVSALKGTYEQLELLLDRGRLTAGTRQLLAAELREAPSLSLVFNHTILTEQYYVPLAAVLIETDRLNDPTQPRLKTLVDEYLFKLMFNPHRTEREYAVFLGEIARLAALRQMEEVDQRIEIFRAQTGRWTLKNQAGREMLHASMTPVFTKTLHAILANEDRRLALLQRLEKP